MTDNNNSQFITKRASLTRSPGFTREEYPYWKDIMAMYIQSTQYKIQLIIMNGDIPTARFEGEQTSVDLAIMELNAKATYTLTYALSKNEYNKICILKITKKIQDSLSISFEGTKDVKLRKIITLTRHYESFSMKDEESMDDVFGRLQVLLNNLETLGQTYTKAQINLKVLDNFLKVWEPKRP